MGWCEATKSSTVTGSINRRLSIRAILVQFNINSIKIQSGLTELVARAAKGQGQGRSNDFSFDKNKRSRLSSEWLASVDDSIVITK